MNQPDIRIISIAPYDFLPIRNGGHQAIARLHHYLALHCPDHVIGTSSNGDNPFAFILHKILPASRRRYIPRQQLDEILSIARENKSTHIICEHPYMAFTAIALSEKLGIPWFLRSHNIESERYRSFGKAFWPGLRIYEQYAMRNADGIFFIAPEDRVWAIDNFKLPSAKCHDIPFGTDMQKIPLVSDGDKNKISTELDAPADVPWLYFLGALDYSPNEQAVLDILDKILPRLNNMGIAFRIFIAGKGLSPVIRDRIGETANIQYTGFVSDLDAFLKSCDIMLNPVIKGGGVKTKAIEALGYNKTVVSAASGAAGISRDVCGSKLSVVADNDWDEFVHAIVKAIHHPVETPDSFYQAYYHDHIARKVLDILKSNTPG